MCNIVSKLFFIVINICPKLVLGLVDFVITVIYITFEHFALASSVKPYSYVISSISLPSCVIYNILLFRVLLSVLKNLFVV